MNHREKMLECASTTLELALWKAVLNDQSLLQQQNLQARTIENTMITREENRLGGGKLCQVVIPNVMSFLL